MAVYGLGPSRRLSGYGMAQQGGYQSTTGRPRPYGPGARPLITGQLPPGMPMASDLRPVQQAIGGTPPAPLMADSPDTFIPSSPQGHFTPAPGGGVPALQQSSPPSPAAPSLQYQQRPLGGIQMVPHGYRGTNFGMSGQRPSVVGGDPPQSAVGQPLPGAAPNPNPYGNAPPPELDSMTPVQRRLAYAESLPAMRAAAGISGPLPQVDQETGLGFIPRYGSIDQSIKGSQFVEGGTRPDTGTRVLRNPNTGGLMLIGAEAARGITPGTLGGPDTMSPEALATSQQVASVRQYGRDGLGGSNRVLQDAQRQKNGGLTNSQLADRSYGDTRASRAFIRNPALAGTPAIAEMLGRRADIAQGKYKVQADAREAENRDRALKADMHAKGQAVLDAELDRKLKAAGPGMFTSGGGQDEILQDHFTKSQALRSRIFGNGPPLNSQGTGNQSGSIGINPANPNRQTNMLPPVGVGGPAPVPTQPSPNEMYPGSSFQITPDLRWDSGIPPNSQWRPPGRTISMPFATPDQYAPEGGIDPSRGIPQQPAPFYGVRRPAVTQSLPPLTTQQKRDDLIRRRLRSPSRAQY